METLKTVTGKNKAKHVKDKELWYCTDRLTGLVFRTVTDTQDIVMLENMTEHYPIIMIRIKECMGRYPTSGSILVSRGGGWGGWGVADHSRWGVIYLRIFGVYIWHECFFQSEPSMMVVNSWVVFLFYFIWALVKRHISGWALSTSQWLLCSTVLCFWAESLHPSHTQLWMSECI